MRAKSRLLRAAVATLAAAVALAGLLVSGAPAEVAQKGGVRVSVTGEMSPSKLPRRGTAPVAVSLAGHIAPTKSGALPQLERIAVAINSHGRLQTRGLPVCRRGHIDPSTTAEALAACGPSLIGQGRFSANVKIPEQSPFPSKGKVLAFNGKLAGRPAIFAHVYGTEPVPTSYVLAFVVKRTKGTYGTLLEASLPGATGEWGYVTGISLKLKRSYLAAGCPAPAGFPGVVFPLMRTSFGFEGGPTLTSTLNRSCQVR
jgi:hypothetical protein